MLLTVALLFFQFPAMGAAASTPQPPPAQPATQSRTAAATDADTSKPAAPSEIAKPNTPASDDHSKSNPLTIQPQPESAALSMSDVYLPSPPAFRPPGEAPITHHRLRFLLSATEHSSAGYDAWSTRYALTHGRIEADPLMRPFANSSAIYGAIQVIPMGLDYVARRFQRSSGWTRHVWWVPQSAATVTFLFSGSYNVTHTN
jgi:hypothetical protein